MLEQLFSILAPIYICAGLGWGWARLGRRYDSELITDLIMNIGAPCLVFSSLVSMELDADAMLGMAGATLLALGVFALVGAIVLRLLDLPATAFLSPLVFPNTGNMGLPICLFAFGEPGLALGVCFFATTTITHYTAGLWLWSGRVSVLQLLRTPLVYAIALAAWALWTGRDVPGWVLDTTSMLGDFTIPLMQFTLGVALGRLAPGRLPRGVLLSALRIGMGFGVGVLLAGLLGLEGVARSVFIVDCSMPVAVFNSMLALRYERRPSEIAGLVVISTLLSFATVPLVLAYLLS